MIAFINKKKKWKIQGLVFISWFFAVLVFSSQHAAAVSIFPCLYLETHFLKLETITISEMHLAGQTSGLMVKPSSCIPPGDFRMVE